MTPLHLHEYHESLGAEFTELNGAEAVRHYGNLAEEHKTLWEAAGILDLSFRSRLCLIGGDRQKFLHGQVTNDIKRLGVGQGCYAALITAKGRMQSDLNIYMLENEILLDFEPGLVAAVTQRLESYIIADDVQIVDVAPHYGLLSVQGPKAAEVLSQLDPPGDIPALKMTFLKGSDALLGEVYLVNNPRLGTVGFDLFVPLDTLRAVAARLVAAVGAVGGRACGWEAFDAARIEAGIPRFGVDMDETNLVPETGIEDRAISYTKGCYIGQEVIARIRTYGQVAKHLQGLVLSGDIATLPGKGTKLFQGDKEAGYITSALHSPKFNANIALGYVRREVSKTGATLTVRTDGYEGIATVVDLPFAL